MTVKINLKRAQRKVLEAGEYKCNIAVAELRKSKADPKSSNLHLELTVDPEAHPEIGSVRLFDERSLKEQSWFRVVEFLEAVKGELQAENEEGDFEFDEDELVGEPVGVVVEIDDTYDPENPRNRITAYFPATDVGVES